MTPISLTDSDTLQHEGSQQLSNDDRSLAHRSMKVLSVRPELVIMSSPTAAVLYYGTTVVRAPNRGFRLAIYTRAGRFSEPWNMNARGGRNPWDAVGRPGGRSSRPTQGAGEVRSRAGQEVGARWPASELAHEQFASRRTSERVLLGSAAALCEGSLCLSAWRTVVASHQPSLPVREPRPSLPCPG